MNEVADFEVGRCYSNDPVRFSLDVETLGGIRPALDANGNVRHVAVLTAAKDSGRMLSETLTGTA
jgi:hypothetical protein